MGVRFKYAGDSNISFGLSGNGAGSTVSGPSGPSYPPAGTFISWENDLPYPAANGGTEVGVSNDGTTYYYPNQIADFQRVADGAGGSYINFNSATNAEFAPYGGNFATFTTSMYLDISTNCNGTVNVYNGTNNNAYYHDGSGSYYSGGGNSYPSNGTGLYSETCTSYEEGGGDIHYSYNADGSGGYTTSQS